MITITKYSDHNYSCFKPQVIDVADFLVVIPMLRMAFIIISAMWMHSDSNRYNVLSALIMHEIDLTYISIPHI